MRMRYIISFNDKPLVLTDSLAGFAKDVMQKPDAIFQDQLNEASVRSMLQKMQEPQVSAGVFLHQCVEALLQAFKKHMTVIQAGGGLVHTDEKTFLLIFRRGKWDLPKGKQDKGETIAETALREVAEETGLTALQLEEPITVTYHTYQEKEELILKESHWFLMKSAQQESLTPQLEEDIEKCVWVKEADLAPYLENTHPSILSVIDLGVKKLQAAKTF